MWPPWRIRELRSQICLHEANLLDLLALQRVLESHPCDVLYHLAAFSHPGRSWARVQECYRVNVEGTLNIISALPLRRGSAHVVYASTSEVGGDVDSSNEEVRLRAAASNPYAVSKLAGEDVCRLYVAQGGMTATLVRIHNVYGPGQSPDRVIPEAIVAAMADKDLPMTTGTQTRDFVHVDDVAQALFTIGDRDPAIGTRVIELASGVSTQIREAVERVYARVGSKGRPILAAIASRSNEIWAVHGDATALRELLGRPPLLLNPGLDRTIKWYRDHAELFV
jgi:nucleoside-diphosphate-sugar epimerase